MMFNEFCETTGLHGWKYLTRVRVKSGDCVKQETFSIINFPSTSHILCNFPGQKSTPDIEGVPLFQSITWFNIDSL